MICGRRESRVALAVAASAVVIVIPLTSAQWQFFSFYLFSFFLFFLLVLFSRVEVLLSPISATTNQPPSLFIFSFSHLCFFPQNIIYLYVCLSLTFASMYDAIFNEIAISVYHLFISLFTLSLHYFHLSILLYPTARLFYYTPSFTHCRL